MMENKVFTTPVADGEVQLIEPNYDGFARVLEAFVELYKVCEKKELVDEAFVRITLPVYCLKMKLDDDKENP